MKKFQRNHLNLLWQDYIYLPGIQVWSIGRLGICFILQKWICKTFCFWQILVELLLFLLKISIMHHWSIKMKWFPYFQDGRLKRYFHFLKMLFYYEYDLPSQKTLVCIWWFYIMKCGIMWKYFLKIHYCLNSYIIVLHSVIHNITNFFWLV